jgi:hypothetical protein
MPSPARGEGTMMCASSSVSPGTFPRCGRSTNRIPFSERDRARVLSDSRRFRSSLRGAKRRSNPDFAAGLDCFAEPVIGPATSGRTRWLAMTKEKGSGTPADAVFHVPRASGARGAPRRGGLRRPPLAGALACRRSTTALAAATERHRSAPVHALPATELVRSGRYPFPAVPVQRVSPQTGHSAGRAF